jgi:hypothetical protein
MKLPHPALLLALTSLLGAACEPDVEDLEVAASIEGATLSIKKSPFGTADAPQGTPEGAFTLTLSLGKYASGGSNVTVQQFAVVSASSEEALLAPVLLQPGAPTSFRVEVDSTQRYTYTLGHDKPVPVGALCAAGQVRYTGTILDGARGKTTPVTSGPIAVSCP